MGFAEDYLRRTQATRVAARLAQIDKYIVEHARRAHPKGIHAAIELGAGHARLLNQVPSKARYAVDRDDRLLRHAPAGIERVLADNRALPFEDASIDAVVSGYGGYRTTTPDRQLEETARVLKDGGTFGFHGFPRARIYLRQFNRDFIDEMEPSHFPAANATRQAFAQHELWIDRVQPWRSTRWPPYCYRVPAFVLRMSWSVAVVGKRMPRAHVSRWRALHEELNRGGRPQVLIAGGSMEPTLSFGHQVSICRIHGAIQRGDIVCLLGRSSFVIHRVRHTFAGAVWLAGDADGGTHRADDWRILGKVIERTTRPLRRH